MADYDRKPDTSIIGRDADAARGDALLDQRARTASERAGGTVDGTAEAEECEGFDIVFEREEPANGAH
ncbi:hypothetical protein FHS95_003916 [Sphingomonas naasensis]|uniref:Uncharacterized protein n=1 Tax=Sphingomonas naasensis TaxID=1344951 RepID=A0A4S1WCV6_9SPHN|nr:hypothetical protein [Sphingomonas naasensis]NIJ22201.1 hypothetical protein [Sphingomonas naasensis]TGX40778.1 hypothetical protein E5A74_14955 [Sphingomonas naasensis]